MTIQLQHQIYLMLLIAGCLYAAIRGGAPERWGAGLLVLAVVATNVALALQWLRYQETYVGAMIVDIVFAAALVVLAVKANRFWPLWAAAVQLDEVLTHLVMFRAATGSFSYAYALLVFSYPLPILLAIGTWRHRRRLKTHGDDPAWS